MWTCTVGNTFHRLFRESWLAPLIIHILFYIAVAGLSSTSGGKDCNSNFFHGSVLPQTDSAISWMRCAWFPGECSLWSRCVTCCRGPWMTRCMTAHVCRNHRILRPVWTGATCTTRPTPPTPICPSSSQRRPGNANTNDACHWSKQFPWNPSLTCCGVKQHHC